MAEILDVQNLETQYKTSTKTVHAINGVSFSVGFGEILGIIGECGSGKTTLIQSILGLLPQPAGKVVQGKILFHSKDILNPSSNDSKHVFNRKIGYAPQEYISAFNHSKTIEEQLSETISESLGIGKPDARDWIYDTFRKVGIPDDSFLLNSTPSQISAGFLQKMLIAKAMVREPDLMIFDQIMPSLDTINQVTILDILKKNIEKSERSIIWISNDIGLTMSIAERVMILYAGRIVEIAEVRTIYSTPLHPYTLGLLGTQLKINRNANLRLNEIFGSAITLDNLPVGCSYANRCRFAIERCRAENPALVNVGPQHQVACWVDTYTGRPR